MVDLEKTRGRLRRGESEDIIPILGEWYWITKGERWLGCVVEVGTNYVELRGPSTKYVGGRYIIRVHFDDILDSLEREPEAERIIASNIFGYQKQVKQLLGEIQQLTARLAVNNNQQVQETQALALRGGGGSMVEYKAALQEAKDKTLPDLFKSVERCNGLAAGWMSASLIPLEAEAEGMKITIKSIERRIFNVELYAGLSEQLIQIADGDTPSSRTPIHLMQRRCYMDEECLANYRVGGMEFKDIGEFDAWVAEKENRDRILPHQRCVVAMQVRRNSKERTCGGLSEYFSIKDKESLDKKTFLYMRNGEKLYRLSTEIEFGENLFPDGSVLETSQRLYSDTKVNGLSFNKCNLITEGEFLQRCQEYEEKKEEWERGDRKFLFCYRDPDDYYEPYSPDSVYYDDVSNFIDDELERHNRTMLVLQGILDRSIAFHPHPVWRLWNGDDFEEAIRLVYDDSRALTDGDPPDFEAYRRKLNSSFAVGSVSVGQETVWLEREAERENERIERSWRERRSEFRYAYFRPGGDPGPGVLSVVAARRPVAHRCKFEWERESRNWSNDNMISCSIWVDDDKLLNVSAYTPGDFKIFFADPRTRANYLQWAPLLLEAEEYHAGNREGF